MGKCFSKSIEEPKETLEQQGEEYASLRLLNDYKLNYLSKELILAALSTNPLFRGLYSKDFETIFKSIKMCTVSEHKFVFQQGSIGSLFFIINSGRVEVIVNNSVRGVLIRERCFGELALLSDSTRKASIKAVTNCSFFIISRNDFLSSIRKLYRRSFDKIRAVISKSKFFGRLPDGQKDLISKKCILYKFVNDDIIIHEGDEGSLVYILKSGSVYFKKNGKTLNKVEETGEIFGEGSMVTGKCRIVSAVANGETEVISINKESMIEIFGEGYKQFLLKNIAMHSILSDSHLAFLKKNDIVKICENLKWKEYDNYSVIISKNYVLQSGIKIICNGTAVSTCGINQRIPSYQVVGLGNINEKSLVKSDYIAEGTTTVGELSKEEIEELIHVKIDSLFELLDRIKFLKKCSIFKESSHASLKFIADKMEKVQFASKAQIFNKNDHSNCFFIVKSGKVEICINGKPVRIVVQGQIFGERSVVETVRSASARTLEISELFLIDKNVVEGLPEQQILKLEVLRKQYFQSEIDFSSIYVVLDYPSNSNRRKYCVKQAKDKNFYDLVVIPKHLIKTQIECYDLVNEKEILMQVDYVLLTKLIRTYRDESNIYFVTEHFSGTYLKPMIPVSEDLAKCVVLFLTSALNYLHEKNIIYRNLDTLSILVNKSGVPYLNDLSCAVICKDRTYTRIGNPYYRSPEMILGRGYSKSTDYWSLGVVLFEIIYGCLPFGIKNSDDPVVAYEKILHNKPEINYDRKDQSCNELILNLLVNGDTRFDYDAVKNSKWVWNMDWDSVNRLNISDHVDPLLIKVDKSISQQKKKKTLSNFKTVKTM